MSFTARMGAWGPVLCRSGPLPRAPGARAQCPRADPTPTLLIFASKIIEICVDFDVDFGSILGLSWGSFSLLLALFST